MADGGRRMADGGRRMADGWAAVQLCSWGTGIVAKAGTLAERALQRISVWLAIALRMPHGRLTTGHVKACRCLPRPAAVVASGSATAQSRAAAAAAALDACVRFTFAWQGVAAVPQAI